MSTVNLPDIGAGIAIAGIISALIGLFLPDNFLRWKFDRGTALGLAFIFVIIGCAVVALIGGLS